MIFFFTNVSGGGGVVNRISYLLFRNIYVLSTTVKFLKIRMLKKQYGGGVNILKNYYWQLFLAMGSPNMNFSEVCFVNASPMIIWQMYSSAGCG